MLTPPPSISKSRSRDHVPEIHFGSQSRKTDGPVSGNIFQFPSVKEACLPLATPPPSPTRAVIIHPAQSRHIPQAAIQDLSPELVENVIARLDNKSLVAVVTISRYYSAVAFREIMERARLLRPVVSLTMRNEFGAIPHLFRTNLGPKECIDAAFIFSDNDTDKQVQLLERYFLRVPLGTAMRRIVLDLSTSVDAASLARLFKAIGRVTCDYMDLSATGALQHASTHTEILTGPTVPQVKSLAIDGQLFFMKPICYWTRHALVLDSIYSLDLRAANLPVDEWEAHLDQTTLPGLRNFTLMDTIVSPSVLRSFLDRHPTIRKLTLNRIAAPSHAIGLRSHIPMLIRVEDVRVNTSYISHLFDGVNAPRLRILAIVIQDLGAASAIASLVLFARCPALLSVEFDISHCGTDLIKQLVGECESHPENVMTLVRCLEFSSIGLDVKWDTDLPHTIKKLLARFPAVDELCFREVRISNDRGLEDLPLLQAVLAASAQLTAISLRLADREIKLTKTCRMLRHYWATPSVFEEF